MVGLDRKQAHASAQLRCADVSGASRMVETPIVLGPSIVVENSQVALDIFPATPSFPLQKWKHNHFLVS